MLVQNIAVQSKIGNYESDQRVSVQSEPIVPPPKGHSPLTKSELETLSCNIIYNKLGLSWAKLSCQLGLGCHAINIYSDYRTNLSLTGTEVAN